MSDEHDDLGLRGLPVRDLDPVRAARLGHELGRAFQEVHERRRAPRPIARVYHRLEPVLVAAVVVLYLGWAFDRVLALYR
jgi:hypothetical protein